MSVPGTVILCVRNHTRSTVLCSRATLARGLRASTRGLLGRNQLSRDEGLIIEAARFLPLMWMHTLFMRFPIDVVFLGRDSRVVKIEASLEPWHVSSIVFGARQAVELSAGAANLANTAIGDLISLDRD